MKQSYSFSLSHAPATQFVEELFPYDYGEFVLSLSKDWRQIATADERTLTWRSDRHSAEILVSADFVEVPESKWAVMADAALNSRHKVLAEVLDQSLTVFNRSAKPYSGGGGLELSYAAHSNDTIHLYLGYVTSRKIFNFSLTGGTNRQEIIQLFDRIMERQLRVTVP